MAFYVSKKDLSWKNAENSQFMKNMAKDGLMDRRQQAEVFEAVKKAAGGGALNREQLSRAFGSLSRKNKYLSKDKIYNLAKKTLSGYNASERISYARDNSGGVSSGSALSARQQRYGLSPSSSAIAAAAPKPIKTIPIKGLSGITKSVNVSFAKTNLPGMRRSA